MIEHFIITTVAAVGATMIVVRSKLFEAVRAWCNKIWDKDKLTPAYMINCPQCAGVWVGLIFSALSVWLLQDMQPKLQVYHLVTVSMATSVLTTLVDQVYYVLAECEEFFKNIRNS